MLQTHAHVLLVLQEGLQRHHLLHARHGGIGHACHASHRQRTAEHCRSSASVVVAGGHGGGGLDSGQRVGGVDGGEVPDAGLHLLDLLLLLVLLGVRELDHQGRAAALHGQAVVHRVDGEDRNLSVGEGNEGATCNFISSNIFLVKIEIFWIDVTFHVTWRICKDIKYRIIAKVHAQV